MIEHVKLTKLERLPRAIAWNMANDIGEGVVWWCNRRYWR